MHVFAILNSSMEMRRPTESHNHFISSNSGIEPPKTGQQFKPYPVGYTRVNAKTSLTLFISRAVQPISTMNDISQQPLIHMLVITYRDNRLIKHAIPAHSILLTSCVARACPSYDLYYTARIPQFPKEEGKKKQTPYHASHLQKSIRPIHHIVQNIPQDRLPLCQDPFASRDSPRAVFLGLPLAILLRRPGRRRG